MTASRKSEWRVNVARLRSLYATRPMARLRRGWLLGWLVPALILAWTPAYAQSPQQIVAQRRAQYPTPLTPAQTVELLRIVAADLNDAGVPGGPFGLLVKTSGSNCAGYSCDILCSGNGPSQQQWDVLADAEGVARPTWTHLDRIVVRPCEIVDTGHPDPAPDPEPVPSCDLSAVLAQLEALSGEQQAFIDLWLKEQERARQAQEQHAQSLEAHREDLRKAKGWARRWLVEKVLPIVGGVVAGWFSRPKDE